jgi:hypothetical protein
LGCHSQGMFGGAKPLSGMVHLSRSAPIVGD